MDIRYNSERERWELYWQGLYITSDNRVALDCLRDRMILALARHDAQKHPDVGGGCIPAVDYEVGTPPREKVKNGKAW